MKVKEVIKQLNELNKHCNEMAECSESDSEWSKDVKALEVAIRLLSRTAREVPVQEQLKKQVRIRAHREKSLSLKQKKFLEDKK